MYFTLTGCLDELIELSGSAEICLWGNVIMLIEHKLVSSNSAKE